MCSQYKYSTNHCVYFSCFVYCLFLLLAFAFVYCLGFCLCLLFVFVFIVCVYCLLLFIVCVYVFIVCVCVYVCQRSQSEKVLAMWAELEVRTVDKGQKLQEAREGQQYYRAVKDIALWLEEVEKQLASDDLGKVGEKSVLNLIPSYT